VKASFILTFLKGLVIVGHSLAVFDNAFGFGNGGLSFAFFATSGFGGHRLIC
jgi:hypothetical protein